LIGGANDDVAKVLVCASLLLVACARHRPFVDLSRDDAGSPGANGRVGADGASDPQEHDVTSPDALADGALDADGAAEPAGVLDADGALDAGAEERPHDAAASPDGDAGGALDVAAPDTPGVQDAGCGDTAGSSANCGACGHGCGGGECRAGVCQPAVVVDHVFPPNGLAVDGDTVFFTADDSVLSCALPGCSKPTQLSNGWLTTGAIVTANREIAFVAAETAYGGPGVHVCPSAGCPSTAAYLSAVNDHPRNLASNGTDIAYDVSAGHGGPFGPEVCIGLADEQCTGTSQGNDQLRQVTGPLAFDGRVLFFLFPSPSGGIFDVGACRPPGLCSVMPSVAGISSSTLAFAAHAGTLYYIAPTTDFSQAQEVLVACAEPDCPQRTTFASSSKRHFTDLAADDSGVYWLETGDGSTGPSVQWCPLSGCTGGSTTLAGDLPADAAHLTVGGGFVYWAEPNQPAANPDGDASLTKTARIMRVPSRPGS
jgi:hypothetical protein